MGHRNAICLLQGTGLRRLACAGRRGLHSALAAALVPVLIAGLANPVAAAQRPAPSSDGTGKIQVSNQVLPPLAHARFCLRYPAQCTQVRGKPRQTFSRQAKLQELQRVNLSVNREIAPQEDPINLGIADEWSLSSSRGDCEDYALTKRKRLLDLGWPSDRLRIATALTADGVGHAVLIARIAGRDFALDNLTGSIRPWHETGYRFLKIQSERDPKIWFAVTPRRSGSETLS